MKFKIRLCDEVTINEVEGTAFRIGRFHFFIFKDKTSWNVSEVKTGMAFNPPFGFSTKKEAIRATGEALKRIGDEKLLEAIDFYIQRFGILNEV
ncbi:MAG: hypothetical protein AAB922_05685 [Patescibacteria group bacterium]